MIARGFDHRAGLLGLLLAAAPAAAFAQDISFNRVGSGARAAGMGNAFIAVSDDGTAASWNPAGLSQLVKPEFSLVHTTTARGNSFQGYRTRDLTAAYTTLDTWSSSADIEFASAAVPFRLVGKPVTLQLGFRRLYQLTRSTQGDYRRVAFSPDARPEANLRVDATSDGSVDLWTVAGALRATDHLSLGFSLDFFDGGWEDRVNLNEEPGVLGATDFLSFGQTSRVDGHNLSLGLLLAHSSFSVGAVYHGMLQGAYTETFSTRSNLVDPFETTSPTGQQLRFPRSIGVGVAWRPRPLLRLALDLTYDEWTRFVIDETPGSPGGEVSGFDGLPPELSATRDTVSVNAGMEKLFIVKSVSVPLRLGLAYEPQGARDPLLREDFKYVGLAAGTGVNTNSLKVDLALQYRWGRFDGADNLSVVYSLGLAEEVGLPPGPEVTGTQSLQELRFKFSVIYRVTNTEKLGDFLKRIFGS